MQSDQSGVVVRDLITERIEAIEAASPDWAEQVMAPARAQRNALLESIGEGLEGRDAAEALGAYVEALEGEMKVLLRRRGRLFWLQIMRRRPPEPIGDSSPWTTGLYRRMMVLAALKHGADPRADEQVVIAGTEQAPTVSAPSALTEEDVVSAAAVEYLAYEMNAAAAAFRRVCKSSRLVVVDDDFRAVADAGLNDLIALHDRRVSMYGSLTGPHGAAVDTRGTDQGDPSYLIALQSNVSRESASNFQLAMGVRPEDAPNYIPVPVSVAAARDVLVRFDDALKAAFGISADELLAPLWGVSMVIVNAFSKEPQLGPQLFRTGYFGFSKGERKRDTAQNAAKWVRHWWAEKRGESLTHEEATDIGLRCFDALTWTDADRSSIDLWGRLPLRLLIDVGDMLLFDLDALAEVVGDIFRTVGAIDGDPDDVKGRGFEEELIRRAADAGHATWHTGSVTNSAGAKREIDASFVIGDTLYLVEAKASFQNLRIDKGDFAALKGRWEKLHDRYLNQARGLKEFIEADRAGRNYEVPPEVTRIEHVVCTPGVEWIPSRDAELWLTDDIPRICTPDELLLILGGAASAPAPARDRQSTV